MSDLRENSPYFFNDSSCGRQFNYELINLFFDHAPFGVYIARDDHFIFANKTLMELSSVNDFSELEKLNIFENIHPDDRDEILEGTKRRQKGEEAYSQITFRIIDPSDGKIRWLRIDSFHIDYEGQGAVMGFLRELTAEFEIIDELNSKNEQLSVLNKISLLSAASNMELQEMLKEILLISVDALNATCGAIHLLQEDENLSVGTCISAVTGSEDSLIRVNNESSPQKTALNNEKIIQVLVEDEVDEQLKKTLMDSGVVMRVICPLRDSEKVCGTLTLGFAEPEIEKTAMSFLESISRNAGTGISRAMMIEKLKTLNHELSQIERTKLNLLSNVSHELRTPLVSVFGYTDLMLDERLGPITDVQRKSLGVCRRNITKLIKLINSLLAFTRLEFGEEELELSQQSMKDLVSETLEDLKQKAKDRKVTIETDFINESFEFVCDPAKIKMMLSELIDNAIKFNHDEGTILIRVRHSDNKMSLAISDSGIGIEASKQEKIFERFYQADAEPSRGYEGMGIGLSIAVGIVKLHGGSITVQSKPGKGSIFNVTLPIKH